MRSYKNLASEYARPWSVTCVHKRWHFEWNTTEFPGRYAGIFGGLLTTKPSYLSMPSPESDLKSNRKPEKAEWTEYLGWLMWCNGYISYEPSYKNNVAVQIQITVRYCRSSVSLVLQSTTWSPGSLLTVGRENLGTRLLCAKFVPTSISSTLYGLLFVICRHVPPTKGLRILGPTIEQTKA